MDSGTAYLIMKWLHVLSATLLFGTGIGSAFLMFAAIRSRDIHFIRFAIRHVVRADWLFTAPSVVFQLASGLVLIWLGGFGPRSAWIMLAIALYLFAGACWLPVVWLQIKMQSMAEAAVTAGGDLPSQFRIYNRWWIVLGLLAFPAVIVIFWLMVAKPA